MTKSTKSAKISMKATKNVASTKKIAKSRRKPKAKINTILVNDSGLPTIHVPKRDSIEMSGVVYINQGALQTWRGFKKTDIRNYELIDIYQFVKTRIGANTVTIPGRGTYVAIDADNLVRA